MAQNNRGRGNRSGSRSSGSNNSASSNSSSNRGRSSGRSNYTASGVVDLARERPVAAPAVAAGAAAAGLFLWSRRSQITDQLSSLSDQIGEWTESFGSGGSEQFGDTGDDTGGYAGGMSETGGGNASLGAASGGGGTTSSASGRGRARSSASTEQ